MKIVKRNTIQQDGATKQGGNYGKPDYARLTFILSFIGFLGSIGFYFGVLREVYSPAKDKEEIEQLKTENADLKETVMVLITELSEHESEE